MSEVGLIAVLLGFGALGSSQLHTLHVGWDGQPHGRDVGGDAASRG